MNPVVDSRWNFLVVLETPLKVKGLRNQAYQEKGFDMNSGSAAKLIVEALLQRFLPLARRRIETAQAQVNYINKDVLDLVILLFPWKP